MVPSHKTYLHNSELTQALMAYENVKIRYLVASDFCNGTELQSWMECDPLWKYSLEQVAEVLKVLLVYKYGGEIFFKIFINSLFFSFYDSRGVYGF